MWIARDNTGTLVLYINKPKLCSDGSFMCGEGFGYFDSENPKICANFFILDPNYFPEVTFENSPIELNLNK